MVFRHGINTWDSIPHKIRSESQETVLQLTNDVLCELRAECEEQ